MSFSAQDVKRLRDETGAPLMECRAALEEAEGDHERAKEILREKGKAAATKRADRETSEGVVAIAASEKGIASVAVECETDFVSGNPDFRTAVNEIAQIVLDKGNSGITVDEALALTSDSGVTVKAMLEELVGKIRENIQLKKVMRLDGSNYGFYLHHDKKKSAIVELSGANPDVARNVGMQVVSMHAEYLKKEDLPQDRIEKEREIQINRALEEGKPRDLAEKIAEGRVNKEFVKEVVLNEQEFILEKGKTVGQYVTEQGNLQVVSFSRMNVGS